MADIREKPKSYSEKSFWNKINKCASVLSCPLLCKALSMYYAARDAKTPTWAKTTIIGALGYLISFVDAIPDIIPIVGYTDDLAVIAAALGVIAFYIKPKHKQNAQRVVERLGLKHCHCTEVVSGDIATVDQDPQENAGSS